MQADDSRTVGSVAPAAGPARAHPSDPTAAEPDSDDSVSLSECAREVQKAKELLSQLPEVREERIAAVRARLAAGDYHVSAPEVAEAVLRHLPEGEPIEPPS